MDIIIETFKNSALSSLEKTAIFSYFISNTTSITVASEILRAFGTENETCQYLKSLIPTPGIFSYKNLIQSALRHQALQDNLTILYPFIDNSNLLIEGKYIVGRLENAGNPTIIGSRPPDEDTLWNSVRDLSFDVTIYDRVADDGDYEPVVREALNLEWKGYLVTLGQQKMKKVYYALDNYYRRFTFAYASRLEGEEVISLIQNHI
ncbi:6317_t:CDS:2 [Ambispora leptoticha]|uniref:6317_t:CDS:1 n=1 Tax=Ambispora leptoticha TaxID=144679 RepID=A0A9N9CBZ1_9GLOM|nr:6317_t:CDS:2 [Ambispora leptoticha]